MIKHAQIVTFISLISYSLSLILSTFQAAAGIFDNLKDNVVSIVQNIRTFDLHPDCLQALGAINLAQAQESFMRKARQGQWSH